MNFFPNGEGTQVGLFRFGEAALVRVEDTKIVQDRRDIGMLRPELLFVNLKRVKIVRFSSFLPARLAKNERHIIQHRAQL